MLVLKMHDANALWNTRGGKPNDEPVEVGRKDVYVFDQRTVNILHAIPPSSPRRRIEGLLLHPRPVAQGECFVSFLDGLDIITYLNDS